MAATQCDSAQFVSDLTIPDGASFAPGAAFTKTWRLMNNGTCAWTTSYSLVWAGGDLIGAPPALKLPVNVPPGQMADISVNLTAPIIGGRYKGLWKISNASGVQFGIGASASDAFWVDINVVEISAVIYDFVANAPYAQWKSGSGVLPYPGTSGDSRGYSYQVNNPHLEDDSFDSSPGLLTVPQNKYNGTIQATYPEIQIQKGDKLQTLVNCEFGAKGCYVTFRIDYLTSTGKQKTLWSWKEAPDGRFYRANIDLSSLAGQQVKFILTLLSSGSASGDRAIWGSPRIVRSGTIQPPAPPSTLTLLPPLTATSTPFDQPVPTIAPYGCNKASFVADITVPDGTFFSPGAAFTKTWRLKNTGSCGWTNSYKFIFYSGEQMSAPTSINLPRNIAPGESVDLTVNMVAPASAGKYRGHWILSNASGALFGIGTNASMPIWVEINVAGGTPTEMGYDFWANACSAQWKSGAGILPCPGVDGDGKGFMIPSNFTKLEDGTTGPAPSLLMAPEYKYNGYIQGIYPTFTVQPGDRFRAVVGCEYDSSCYVTFQLDYMTASGSIKNFWTWREQKDGRNFTADLSLSPLAGQSVRFILTIQATGSAAGDRVRWTAPYIVRAVGPPPTVTPVPPPTITPTQIVSPGTVVTSPYIRKLFMIDSSNGWAIGDSYLLRTTDGGVTWYNVAPSGISSVRNGFFPNSSKGWVLTALSQTNPGSLYRTTDGGVTWTRYDVPFNNGTIQFLDDTHGFVLSILGAAMSKQAVAVYQTSDGGATWVRNYVNDPTIPGASTSLPLGGHKDGMTFRDTSHGWIGGDTPADGFVYLYTTADSGVTWSQQPLALPSGYESAFVITSGPIFFGANDAILPVWLGTDTSRDLFIYTSHNGGVTWTVSSAFARAGENADFVSLNDAFSWDWANIFHVTNDAGNSWKQVTPNVDFSNDFRGMDFVSTTTGWVILGHANGYTSLYRTSDGGYTWTLLSTNLPTPTFTPTATPTPTPIASDWLSYTNSYYGFQLKYPPRLEDIPSQDNNYARINLSIQAGTNLMEKYLEVIVAENANPCQSPLASQSMLQSSETITMNGISFLKQIGEDGGMSHLHQWIAYSTLRDNVCVSLDFILHSVNPGVYTTPPPLFDYAAETTVFGDMVSTFAWLTPTATPTPFPTITVTPTSMAVVQSVEIQILEAQPLGVNAIIRGQLPDTGCTNIPGIGQARDGNTLHLTLATITDPLSVCTPALTPFEQVIALDVSSLPPARYIVNANGFEQSFELVTRDFTKFGQLLVDTLNALNFDLLKVLMDQSFGFGFWQSEGFFSPPDLAIEQLRSYLGASTVLTADPTRDLSILLGGFDPYAIVGLDAAKSQALFVSGWGLDGKGEAILYVTRLPDGSLYWYGVLIAPGGFTNP
jgi:photosystem II stability/assembly factor-like uncharacterized protein